MDDQFLYVIVREVGEYSERIVTPVWYTDRQGLQQAQKRVKKLTRIFQALSRAVDDIRYQDDKRERVKQLYRRANRIDPGYAVEPWSEGLEIPFVGSSFAPRYLIVEVLKLPSGLGKRNQEVEHA